MGDRLYRELVEKWNRYEIGRRGTGLESHISRIIGDIRDEDHAVTNTYFREDILGVYEQLQDPEILIAYGQSSVNPSDKRYSQKFLNLLMKYLKQLQGA